MFQIIGDEIHFSGYKVATLCEKGCPPSVRARVERIVRSMNYDSYRTGYEEGKREAESQGRETAYRQGYEAGKQDGFADGLEEGVRSVDR